MKNIHNFSNENAFNIFMQSGKYKEPFVSLTKDTNRIDYNDYEHYKKMYLTFEILTDGSISWNRANKDMPWLTIEYRLNKNDWTSFTATSTSFNQLITSVHAGDIISFRGNNSCYYQYAYQKFDASCDLNIFGNIMSMINSENFYNLTSFSNTNVFPYLFKYMNIIDASKLILPATTLTDNCYAFMFDSASKLIYPPKLPATTLAKGCYSAMFHGCSSLSTCPDLPATTLANCCYGMGDLWSGASDWRYGMFEGCTSITTSPKLPATTLAERCYQQMFKGCTNLIMSPELPATTLVNSCYSAMFNGCTNLNYVKCLATDVSASYCTNNWLTGVSSTGTFVKDANATWSTGTSGIPEGWTVETATA